MTFSLGNAIGGTGGQVVAYFKSYQTLYPMAIDTTLLPAGTWKQYTMTQTNKQAANPR